MKQTKPNWPLLAAARFFLAFVVMADHFGQQGGVLALVPFGRFFDSTAAVRGFLLISGFSIAHSIAKQPQGYAMRRVERIMPTYLIAILAAMAYAAIGWVEAPTPFQLACSLLMLQTFFAPAIGGLGPSWTLSLECGYYALAPLLRKLSPRVAVGAMLLSGAIFYAHGPLHFRDWWSMVGLLPFAGLAWPWMAGWLMYVNAGRCRQAAIYTTVFLSATESLYESRGSAVMVIAVAVLLLHSHAVKLPSVVKRVAIYAGDVSYPLYLTHYFAMIALRANNAPTNAFLWVGCGLSVAMAVLHLERGAIWLRSKLRRQESLPEPQTPGLPAPALQ